VLALALIGLLVAAHADTAVRLPGTTLRFGLTDSTLSARGFTAAEAGSRQGRCRFFGLESQATLRLESQRLARAEFEVDSASTYEVSYVMDQLTAMGYRRSCAQPAPQIEVCDFTARTRIHLEVNGPSLKASVAPAGALDGAPAAPRPTVPDAGFGAAERVIARLRGGPAPAESAARVAPVPRPDTTRPAPGGAPAPLPPRDSARTAPVRGAAPPGPLRDSARIVPPAVGAAPVLPETLAVRLAGRESRYAPATVLSQPRCVYPEEASAAGIQGRVWVLALVDTDGRVIRAHVSRGIPALDAAALRCVKDWSFKPASWKGAPCRFWAIVPVTLTVD